MGLLMRTSFIGVFIRPYTRSDYNYSLLKPDFLSLAWFINTYTKRSEKSLHRGGNTNPVKAYYGLRTSFM